MLMLLVLTEFSYSFDATRFDKLTSGYSKGESTLK